MNQIENLKNSINSIELKDGVSKNPFWNINDFISAMLEDLDLLFADIKTIWDNYAEMVKLKPTIISNILKTDYIESQSNYLGKLLY